MPEVLLTSKTLRTVSLSANCLSIKDILDVGCRSGFNKILGVNPVEKHQSGNFEQNFEKSLTSRNSFNPERQIALESERHEDRRRPRTICLLNFEIAEWCKKTGLEVRFKKWAPQQKIQKMNDDGRCSFSKAHSRPKGLESQPIRLCIQACHYSIR